MIFDILFTVNGITAFLALVIFILLWLDVRRPSDLPPGPPITIPIFGHLMQFTPETLLQKLAEYRQQYGDIYSLKMGSKWFIVFNGYDTLREAFVKNGEVFSSRPNVFQFRDIAKFKGIVASKGHLWKEHRTFALTKLREFNFGKKSLETNILQEVEVLINTMESQKGKPLDIYDLLNACISNVICVLVFGKRYEYTDPIFIKIVSMLRENLKTANAASGIVWLPFLRYLPEKFSGRKKFMTNLNKIHNFLGDIIDEHWKTFDENFNRDYIDTFITEMKRQGHAKDSTFTDFQLKRTILEFFVAGTDTTSSTLLWAIVYLIRNQDVQDKMREEIGKVVGMSQFPRLQHRQDMHYTEAVITEVQRCGDIVPLSVFHGTDRDTIFRGYRIPKEAVLAPNLDSVLHDAKEFKEPYKFNPSRFLDQEGRFCGQEKVIPFSLGRRVCLGESLARMELFLFLTTMVQRFKFLPEKGKPLPSEDPVMGTFRSPQRFKFCPVSVN